MAAPVDELPTEIHMPALRIAPVTATELAPVVARPTAAPQDGDRTEALPRVHRPPVVDATEVLANVAREVPAEATVSQMRPLVVDDEVTAPAKVLRISPQPAPVRVVAAPERVVPPVAVAPTGLSQQQRLLVVNLAIVGLIVLGLLITAMLR